MTDATTAADDYDAWLDRAARELNQIQAELNRVRAMLARLRADRPG